MCQLPTYPFTGSARCWRAAATDHGHTEAPRHRALLGFGGGRHADRGTREQGRHSAQLESGRSDSSARLPASAKASARLAVALRAKAAVHAFSWSCITTGNLSRVTAGAASHAVDARASAGYESKAAFPAAASAARERQAGQRRHPSSRTRRVSITGTAHPLIRHLPTPKRQCSAGQAPDPARSPSTL